MAVRLSRFTIGLSALMLLTTTGVVGLGGAVAQAAPGAAAPQCPPATASLGVQYVGQSVYGHDEPQFSATIVGDAFPGVGVENSGWSTEYQGAPTTVGLNSFQVTLHDGRSGVDTTVDCRVMVLNDVALDNDTFTVSRITAADRFAEAVAISQTLVPAGQTAPLVYIASGEGFADALSGASIAAQRGAPLLLVRSTSVPAAVMAEINRLQPRDIVVLGGEATITPAAWDELRQRDPGTEYTRIGGADRFEVSRNLITNPRFGAAPSESIYLASGRVFPDALSAGPAAARTVSPVLLIDGRATALTAAERAIVEARAASDVRILGGTNTITSDLATDVHSTGVPVRRLGGADRYRVSSAIADSIFARGRGGSAVVETVYLATGADYPDALAGSVLAESTDSPIMLVTRDCIPVDTAYRLNKLHTTKLVLLGGPASLGAGVESLTVCEH